MVELPFLIFWSLSNTREYAFVTSTNKLYAMDQQDMVSVLLYHHFLTHCDDFLRADGLNIMNNENSKHLILYRNK